MNTSDTQLHSTFFSLFHRLGFLTKLLLCSSSKRFSNKTPVTFFFSPLILVCFPAKGMKSNFLSYFKLITIQVYKHLRLPSRRTGLTVWRWRCRQALLFFGFVFPSPLTVHQSSFHFVPGFFSPLCSSVLEPCFHLCFSEVQCWG